MNIQKMMAEAKKLQANMEKKLKEFDEKEFQFNYKKYINVKLKGSLQIISIDIDKQLVDPEDKNILEEMVCEAINEAIENVSKEKDKITNISIPGLPF